MKDLNEEKVTIKRVQSEWQMGSKKWRNYQLLCLLFKIIIKLKCKFIWVNMFADDVVICD